MKTEHLYFEGKRCGVSPAVIASRAKALDVCAPPVGNYNGLDDALDEFVSWVLEQGGIAAASYRPKTLMRRLPACLRALGVTSVPHARQAVQARPGLARELANVFLLGVTQFYRDKQAFELLETRVLPELLSRIPRPRIWSAACSDGHELYSVAILLDRLGRLGDCDLLGTDCRSDATRSAREGVFQDVELRGLEPSAKERYFIRIAGDRYRAVGLLLDSVRWETADLLGGATPGPWDLILWRNMSIYLRPEPALSVWRSINQVLSPGGYVVTGKADHPPAELQLARVGTCVYRKRDE